MHLERSKLYLNATTGSTFYLSIYELVICKCIIYLFFSQQNEVIFPSTFCTSLISTSYAPWFAVISNYFVTQAFMSQLVLANHKCLSVSTCPSHIFIHRETNKRPIKLGGGEEGKSWGSSIAPSLEAATQWDRVSTSEGRGKERWSQRVAGVATQVKGSCEVCLARRRCPPALNPFIHLLSLSHVASYLRPPSRASANGGLAAQGFIRIPAALHYSLSARFDCFSAPQ